MNCDPHPPPLWQVRVRVFPPLRLDLRDFLERRTRRLVWVFFLLALGFRERRILLDLTRDIYNTFR